MMTDAEKKQMLAVVRAVEHLFLENAALKTVLISHRVQNWQGEMERLTSDPQSVQEAHARFEQLYESIAQSADDSAVIEAFLRALPKSDKAN